jgi:hypothetical protein
VKDIVKMSVVLPELEIIAWCTWYIVPVHFCEISRCKGHACQLLPYRFSEI